MKKIYPLLIILFLFSDKGKCQNYQHELGINIFKYHPAILEDLNYGGQKTQLGIKEWSFPRGWDLDNFNVLVSPHLFYSTTIYNGIRFRASFQFKSERFDRPFFESPWFWQYGSRNKLEYYYFSEGIQLNLLRKRKFSPYILTDLNILLQRSDHKYYDEKGQFMYAAKSGPDYSFDLLLGIGLKYQFSKRFSTSMEITDYTSALGYLISRLSINYHF